MTMMMINDDVDNDDGDDDDDDDDDEHFPNISLLKPHSIKHPHPIDDPSWFLALVPGSWLCYPAVWHAHHEVFTRPENTLSTNHIFQFHLSVTAATLISIKARWTWKESEKRGVIIIEIVNVSANKEPEP